MISSPSQMVYNIHRMSLELSMTGLTTQLHLAGAD